MQNPIELSRQRLTSRQTRRCMAPHSHGDPSVAAEPPLYPEPEPLGEHCIITDLWMNVERNVSSIERDVMIEQGGNSAVSATGERHVSVPEQPVVDQKERRRLTRFQRSDDPVYGCLRSIHCRNDTAHLTAVFNLKAIYRIGLVRDLLDSEILVQVCHQVAK